MALPTIIIIILLLLSVACETKATWMQGLLPFVKDGATSTSRVHLLLELDGSLEVGMCLLRMLSEVDHLAVIVRSCLMLWQVLRRGVLCLSR